MAGLKPQDFAGLAGAKIKISSLPDKIVSAIRKRKDLPIGVSNYLVKLVQYIDNPTAAKKSELKKFYGKVDASFKSGIQKDFSELLGPMIIYNDKSSAKDLGLTVTSQSSMLIPTAGNFPLVDFMIYTGSVEDRYSVKTLQKATNTLKAGDVLNTVPNSLKKKYTKETQILKTINDNDAKRGPILVLAQISSMIPEFKKDNKLYRTFISKAGSISDDVIGENPEGWYDLFEPVIDAYYSKGKGTIGKAWKREYYYDALTVLAQYTVADVTKDMNWSPFVDSVQKQVTYFKFGMKTDGTYDYKIINGISERTANMKFRLRAKSRLKEGAESTRSGQDKLGIQP